MRISACTYLVQNIQQNVKWKSDKAVWIVYLAIYLFIHFEKLGMQMLYIFGVVISTQW